MRSPGEDRQDVLESARRRGVRAVETSALVYFGAVFAWLSAFLLALIVIGPQLWLFGIFLAGLVALIAVLHRVVPVRAPRGDWSRRATIATLPAWFALAVLMATGALEDGTARVVLRVLVVVSVAIAAGRLAQAAARLVRR